jgi:hypothetical protein
MYFERDLALCVLPGRPAGWSYKLYPDQHKTFRRLDRSFIIRVAFDFDALLKCLLPGSPPWKDLISYQFFNLVPKRYPAQPLEASVKMPYSSQLMGPKRVCSDLGAVRSNLPRASHGP